MGTHRFLLLDVFTDTPLTGNPLAVFPEADDLGERAMQAIARELNLSETTFVVSPRDRRATRRLRSFSPVAEVFGAGHNALGAWWALVAGGHVPLKGSETVWQELGQQVLPVDVTFDSGSLSRVAMVQLPSRESSTSIDRALLARALSIDLEALTVANLEPAVVTTGATTHFLLPLRRRVDLARVRIDSERLTALVKPLGCEGCYCFCLDAAGETSVAHARGFFPGIGIAEDAATGSAAGPLGRYLAGRGLATPDTWFAIEQGHEMNRPSRIDVRVSGEQVVVGGSCALIGSGTIALP